MPIVSIILPSYKEATYIVRTIDSVIGQSFSDWELIIINDGLTTTALKRISSILESDKRIKLIVNPKNLGIQKSLNQGLLEATGQYIARIDDDDQWIDKEKLKKQVEFLNDNKDYVLVGTDGITCDEDFNILQSYSMPKSDREIRNRLLFKNCFLHSTVMIRKTALDNVGGYLESVGVRNVEDYDLWLRLGQGGKIVNLDLKSTRLMVGNNSITTKNRLNQARRDILLTLRYRKHYSYFIFALLVSTLRLFFFCLDSIIPIPRKILYKIQAMYKAI